MKYKKKDILKFLILNINERNNNIYIKQSNGTQSDWGRLDTYDEEGKCSDKNYYLNKLSDYGDDEKYLMSISDYHHNHMYYKYVPHANATRLRLNYLDGVVSILYIDIHNNIKDKIIHEIDNPNLGINNIRIEYYEKKALSEFIKFNERLNDGIHYQEQNLIKYFGSFTSQVIYNNNPSEVIDIIIKNIRDNEKICKEDLKGIKWITKNPGRQ